MSNDHMITLKEQTDRSFFMQCTLEISLAVRTGSAPGPKLCSCIVNHAVTFLATISNMDEILVMVGMAI